MNTILFDLDGTLLPMDVEEFTKRYFYAIQESFKHRSDTILQGVIAGVKSMVKNNGEETNENVFWKTFTQVTNIEKEEVETEFEQFYRSVFPQLNDGKQNQNMIDAVQILKAKGYRLLLATNPLFPRMATEERVRWAGLDITDFDVITTYENCSACKPNPAYFEELLEKNKVIKEECMMVGNDAQEDGVIEKLGIPLYLVNDYLINREDKKITCKWVSDSSEFLRFVKELENIV